MSTTPPAKKSAAGPQARRSGQSPTLASDPSALPGAPTPPTKPAKPPVILNVAYKAQVLAGDRTVFEDVRIFGTDKAAYAFARTPEGRGWSFVDVEKGASIAAAVKADLA